MYRPDLKFALKNLKTTLYIGQRFIATDDLFW